jgi:hypothetical protein
LAGLVIPASGLRAATLGESLPGMVHRLTVVAFERFYEDTLKAGGKSPERCLLSGHQCGVDPARVFPAVKQLEQDKGFV